MGRKQEETVLCQICQKHKKVSEVRQKFVISG